MIVITCMCNSFSGGGAQTVLIWTNSWQKGAETGVTPTFCLTGDDEALGQGRRTWTIVLSDQMAFKCKFPLGPKGDMASALALLIWTHMWCILICIMGRMEMRGQLCQPKTKRRKKKGRRTDAILQNCICPAQRCDILRFISPPLLIMIRGCIHHSLCVRLLCFGCCWMADSQHAVISTEHTLLLLKYFLLRS